MTVAADKIVTYGELKKELVSIISGLAKDAVDLGMKSDSKSFEELKIRVQEGKLKVIVIGEFNRGKSTFINALLGDSVLPTAVRPTTATINIVNYGDEPEAIVNFKDGHKQKIDIEKLEEYVTVQGRELADVKFVEINYPTSFCKGGVSIIDTPGVNDLDKQREEVTYGFIPGADAAVLVLDSEAAVSQSEMVFLQDKVLKNDIKKIFVVLNKCEQLDEDDLNEVLEYARDKLKDVASSERIFPLSARDALKKALAEKEGALQNKLNGDESAGSESDNGGTGKSTGLPEFRSALSNFLLEERGKTLLSVPVGRAIRLSGRMLAISALRKESLDMDAAGQNDRLAKLEPAIKEHEEARERLGKRMEKANRELSRFFEAKVREDMVTVGKEMDEIIGETHIEADYVKDILPDIMNKKIVSILEENQKLIKERIGELEKRAIEDVQKCISHLDTIVFREISFHEQKKLIEGLHLEKSAIDSEGMMFELGPVLTLGGFSYVGWMVLGVLGVIPALFGAAYIKDLIGDKQQERLTADLKKSISSLVKDMEKKIVDGSTLSIKKTLDIILVELTKQIDESHQGAKDSFQKMALDLKKSDSERKEAKERYTSIAEGINKSSNRLADLAKSLS